MSCKETLAALDDSAVLLRRFVHTTRFSEDPVIVHLRLKTIDFLKRNDLSGSPLRKEDKTSG